MVCQEFSFITDTAVCGVINGWNTYITGSIVLTFLFILLFLLVFGMIFRLNTIVIFILLIPFIILTIASIGSGFGGIMLFVIIVLFALFFIWVFKR